MPELDSDPSGRQAPQVTRQYNRWARLYDVLWRRYENKTLPVAQETAAVAPGELVIDLAWGMMVVEATSPESS